MQQWRNLGMWADGGAIWARVDRNLGAETTQPGCESRHLCIPARRHDGVHTQPRARPVLRVAARWTSWAGAPARPSARRLRHAYNGSGSRFWCIPGAGGVPLRRAMMLGRVVVTAGWVIFGAMPWPCPPSQLRPVAHWPACVRRWPAAHARWPVRCHGTRRAVRNATSEAERFDDAPTTMRRLEPWARSVDAHAGQQRGVCAWREGQE